MTVLVLGGSGMLGHKLTHTLSRARDFTDVHATVRAPLPDRFCAPGVVYHHGVNVGPGTGTLRALLARLAPDVVLNAVGAIKQKDLASVTEETFFVNGSLPHLIALQNPNPQSRVVHFSTDCVFTGEHGGYTERNRPDAEDLYGRSKAVGELDYGAHLTLRTSIIGFELSGHLSLLSWLLRQPAGSTVHGFRRAILLRVAHLHPRSDGRGGVTLPPQLARSVSRGFGADRQVPPTGAGEPDLGPGASSPPR